MGDGGEIYPMGFQGSTSRSGKSFGGGSAAWRCACRLIWRRVRGASSLDCLVCMAPDYLHCCGNSTWRMGTCCVFASGSTAGRCAEIWGATIDVSPILRRLNVALLRAEPMPETLNIHERLYYRDRLREARYAALADAEGFGEICFALEALGLRVHGKQEALGKYREKIEKFARDSTALTHLVQALPSRFKSFRALFDIVLAARNDAMHTGAYARHATAAAIELCIGLEEGLMADPEGNDVARTVGNLMVTSPMTVEPWQAVAHARQLMLMHSFSFLPVRLGTSWRLLSELGLAKYLNGGERKTRLCESIESASGNGLELVFIEDAALLRPDMLVTDVLQKAQVQEGPMLWLVVEDRHPERLCGILTPFELM